jgi:tRNA dimethylallyltransferase
MADGLAITGPTASGKTGLSIAVAGALNGEIISLDSRQIYRGMDIGTAKPSLMQRAQARHFGIDLLAPSERYSAGRFAADAHRWIEGIQARAHVPVLVGGTGFFLRALTHPLFAEPPLERPRREELKQYLARYTREELLRWLAVLDPVSTRRLAAAGGRQRAARAVEVALLTGHPLSSWQREQDPTTRPLILPTFVLQLRRDLLYQRIEERVDHMIAAGLVPEVKALLDAGFDAQSPGMNATGYIELIPYLRGEATLETAVDAIKRATRRYARRQLTWFRHQLGADVIPLDATRSHEELTSEIVAVWHAHGGGGS